MTIRTDVTLDWDSSPRVLTVLSPSTELTIQDLVDTLRDFEDGPKGMTEDSLVDAAGKEFLGGTTYVGVTATLQNCIIAFEARGGPSWVLCSISGGNVVAVDGNGDPIDARLPTAYVSVDRTASASATLQEQEALQYSSFEGVVTYDSSSTYSGTEFPVGTLQAPVNNFSDALAISAERGLSTIRIIGDAEVNGGLNFSGITFIGESMSKSEITVLTGANVYRSEFYDCTLSGILDGEAVAKDCRIVGLTYINGIVERCLLDGGDIVLGGTDEAIFLDCWCASPTALPSIDMGGSGQSLSMRNYSGGVNIKNKTGSDAVSITLLAGQVTLESTVTDGGFYICGNGVLIDNSTGSATVNSSDLLNPSTISNAVWSNTSAETILKTLINKRSIVKTGSVWQLIIYDNDDTTPILVKDLKDKDGSNITDLDAGVLAQELKSSV